MRVIAGSAKGMKLLTAEGLNTRPTTDRVKEALFSMIQFELSGAVVWDAFAGSGALGIEALSRGASFADFTEQSKRSQQAIMNNLKNANFSRDSYRLLAQTALSHLQKTDRIYDVVFFDPPYNKGLIQPLIDILASKISADGLVVIEHDGREHFTPNSDCFTLYKQKNYGKINIHIYRRTYADCNLSR